MGLLTRMRIDDGLMFLIFTLMAIIIISGDQLLREFVLVTDSDSILFDHLCLFSKFSFLLLFLLHVSFVSLLYCAYIPFVSEHMNFDFDFGPLFFTD